MSKRDELLDKALDLFAKEGYSSVGVQKIVDEVGVKKPTLYHYFKNKEGLLEEILKENFDGFLEKVKEKTNYKNDIVMNLEGIIFEYMDFAEKNTIFYRLILSLSFAPEESKEYALMLKYLISQHRLLEDLFEKAEKDHGNMIGRKTMYAFSFIGIINAAISYYLVTKDKKDLSKDSARKVCRQFMHGIFS